MDNYTIKDIESVINGIDGKITKVDVSRLTTPGENYITLVFRVDFEVEKDGHKKTVSTVVKRLPFNHNEHMGGISTVAMRTEINWYSEFLPQFKQFAQELGISSDYFPEFLGARVSFDKSQTKPDEDSLLILENLIPQGYKNEDRYVGFDLRTTKAILKRLAAFHATSLIMKFKRPEVFESIKDYVQKSVRDIPKRPSENEAGEQKGPFSLKIFDNMLDIPACQPYKENIEAVKLKPQGFEHWFKPGPEPWNTIIHCDCWMNNIMVKHRQEDEEPLVKLVDFQIIMYGSYARDLTFVLLTSVNNDVLQQNFDDLLRYYYDEFTSLLEGAHVPELKLSYEDYLEEAKRVALVSEAAHAIFFSSVVLAQKGAAPDFLAGEGKMEDIMAHMTNNINELQKAKLGVITKLCAERGWL